MLCLHNWLGVALLGWHALALAFRRDLGHEGISWETRVLEHQRALLDWAQLGVGICQIASHLATARAAVEPPIADAES